MKGLETEINEIPAKARICLNANQNLELPKAVNYVGMGSSYYAPLTLYYCGIKISPQIASEYYYYLSEITQPVGVLISQSGESSETVWCMERFSEVISVTDNIGSSLGKSKQVIQIFSGSEEFSSTKSYVNTLVTLYAGLGVNPVEAIIKLENSFDQLKQAANSSAQKILEYSKNREVKGYYVIGSGPNYATAQQAALTLSETTKLSWVGMSVAQ